MEEKLKKKMAALKSFYEMLFPYDLEEGEYVRILIMKGGIPDDRYVKSFDEFCRNVNENASFDIFVNLSTVMRQPDGKLDGTSECMYKRHVLFVDFDLKDYPETKNVEYFAKRIKSEIPVFLHMEVDSGHGFHFYICIKPTDNQLAVEVNKQIAKIVGSDENAVKSTQLARVPTTINNKNQKERKYVKIICDGTTGDGFHRYPLWYVNSLVMPAKMRRDIQDKAKKVVKPKECLAIGDYPCMISIMKDGVKKGERNTCLGYIVNAYRQWGCSKADTLQFVLEWNAKKCDPPKSERVLEADFNRFWNGKYRMFKCVKSETNPRRKNILEKRCCAEECSAKNYISPSEKYCFRISDYIFKNSETNKLSGYSINVLSEISRSVNKKGEITLKKLKEKLTFNRKMCMSRSTLMKCLYDLKKRGMILIEQIENSDDGMIIRLGKKASYEKGWINCAKIAHDALKKKLIKANDFKVYITLVYCLEKRLGVTYDYLSLYSGIDTATISKCVANLVKNGLIIVHKKFNSDKNTNYNHYIIIY